MKKKLKYIIPIAILILFTGVFFSKQASASSQNLHSKGILLLKEGADFAFYADDIYYLQRELDALFNEIN